VGAKGDTGAAGSNGAPGAPGPEGPEGPEGEEGSPWTAGGKLPKGSTETGTFTPPTVANTPYGPLGGFINEGEAYLLPVSFPIPLASASEFIFVPNAGNKFGSAAGCPGVVNGTAKADTGKFCVYLAGNPLGLDSPEVNDNLIDPDSPTETGPSGTMLSVRCKEKAFEGFCEALGLWAVTG
jgi:hypothetical protein